MGTSVYKGLKRGGRENRGRGEKEEVSENREGEGEEGEGEREEEEKRKGRGRSSRREGEDPQRLGRQHSSAAVLRAVPRPGGPG